MWQSLVDLWLLPPISPYLEAAPSFQCGQPPLTSWVHLGVTFKKCTPLLWPGGQHMTHTGPESLCPHILTLGWVDQTDGRGAH